MILEGIVTTQGNSGGLNVAPMGARLIKGLECFRLRPFQTSTTYKNLKENAEGVFHVTDDVLLLAKAAIGVEIAPPTRPANRIRGRILIDACRSYEFRVVNEEEIEGPASFIVETLDVGRHRDFLGFNRAKHAVIEAAILATRVDFLPADLILSEFTKLRVIVEKTAGEDEFEAFRILKVHVQNAIRSKTKPDLSTK